MSQLYLRKVEASNKVIKLLMNECDFFSRIKFINASVKFLK